MNGDTKSKSNGSSKNGVVKKEPTDHHKDIKKESKENKHNNSIKKEPSINGHSNNKTPSASSSSSSVIKDKIKSEKKEQHSTPKNQTNGKHDKLVSKSANGSSTSSSVKKEKHEPQIKNEAKTPTKVDTSKSKKRTAEDTSMTTESPKKRKKKEEEEEEVWRWWEEKKYTDGRKWTTLEHIGPMFDEGYIPLADNVKFYYDGKPMKLSVDSEEVMTFYARMIDHDYTQKEAFNTNFLRDWRDSMTLQEKGIIKDLKKCNFQEVYDYYKKKSEERKAMSKEEKKKLKEEAAEIKKKYGFCIWDGHKQPIGNYKIEPPGLFRGRGEHPKMGSLKKRITPENVIINCGKDSKIPSPPAGHKWKEVRHDNMVAWLACWTENVQGNTKYVMLNAASRVKGERDWQKYEKARKLHRCIDKIRSNYRDDWKSKEMKVRQRAVAIYFIDKLALRAGNEKDEDEADTVGCCSLRIEHIKLHKDVEGVGEYVVEFDFLGKDSIRYQNKVAVEKQVYKNLVLFMENKNSEDELFDRLNTTILNAYLNECMEGLSAKVFRTYNASRTLQEQLDQMTNCKLLFFIIIEL
jgi:DNA topoisomerase-1